MNKDNIMDLTPFFVINMSSLDDRTVEYLDKFAKGNLDVNCLMSTAKEFKYQSLVKDNFKKLLEDPSDIFTKALLGDEVRTKKEVLQYKPLVKKTINLYINDMMSERFGETLNKSYLTIEGEEIPGDILEEGEYLDIDMGDGIITTKEEQEGFDIVKSILSKYVDADRLSYKDRKTCFNIILDGRITQWICRFDFNKSTFHVQIPYEKVIERQCRVKRDFALKSLDEIYSLESELVA